MSRTCQIVSLVVFLLALSSYAGESDQLKEPASSTLKNSSLTMEYLPNIPNSWLGFRIGMVFPEKKMGFFLGLSAEVNSFGDDTYDRLTKNPLGHTVQDTIYNYLNVTVGYILPLNDLLWPYVSLGGVGKNAYLKLQDDTGILGDEGIYYTPHTANDERSVVVGAGCLFKFKHLVTSVGVEYPAALLLGIGFDFFSLM